VWSSSAPLISREIYEPITEQVFEYPFHKYCPNRNHPRFLLTDTNSAELIHG